MTEMPYMLHDLLRVNFDGTFHEKDKPAAVLGHEFYPNITDSHRE